MVKKSLKFAIPVSIGMTLGSLIIPRITSSEPYNETYPPFVVHLIVYLVLSYIVAFLVTLFIEWIKHKFID